MTTANQEIIAELRRVLGERDEAREQRDKLLDREAFLESYSETLQGYQTDLARMLKAVCAERDQARRDLANAQEAAAHVEEERDEHKAKREEYAAEARSLRERLKDAYRERDEARAEVEQMKADVLCLELGLTVSNEAYRAGYKAGKRDAYRRGAEAMREACARYIEGEDEMFADNGLRALPIPEER